MVLEGSPMVLEGSPMVLEGSPMVLEGSPVVLAEPLVLVSRLGYWCLLQQGSLGVPLWVMVEEHWYLPR